MIHIRKSLQKKLSGTGAPIASFALAALLCIGTPGHAQNVEGQNNNTPAPTPAPMPSPRSMPAPDPDVTQSELANFNHFLDSHPELAEQLRKDPSLVNNEEYVENHPVLQQYLQEHPEVREELQENPSAFMRQEQSYDRREDRQGERTRLAQTDKFLDSHPEIAEQLRKDPSLINNPRFVEEHPALQQYLQEHPEIRAQLQENPNAFMEQEERYDRREDRQGERTRLAQTDKFLDSHPEIAEQLRKDPSLINNPRFVEEHPALQQYLQEHPEIRAQLQENPNAFMQQEERYDRREDRQGEWSRLAGTDHFLDSHPEIAEQLEKNPSLVNDPHFVQAHPALQEYLQQHPEIRAQFQQNPTAFMQQQQRFEQREDGAGAGFGQFLGSHASIAHQLSQDPSLVNNKDYLEDHPDLQQYLKAHPDAKQEFSENPNAFLSALQSGENMPGNGTTSNTKNAGTAPKPKP